MGRKKNISQKDRMCELLKSFEQKNEVLKEESAIVDDEKATLEESARFKTLSKHRLEEWIANPKFNNTYPNAGGQGVTVNTFIPNTAEQNVKMYNPNYTYLQSGEALELSIRRAIESGAPVNNMEFYDEVNWNMNNMGFNPQAPIDIKNRMKKMLNA